jgi:uncharacterized protein DUF547
MLSSAFSALTLALALALAPAQVKPEAAKEYAELLSKYVRNGRVDYKGLAANDLARLDAYLKAVGEATAPKDKSQAIAFYVDAYNATVLRAVIEHKMPKSVLDVKGFFDAEKHRIAGKDLTLNQLEKEVLNPFAKDPRTHMVLVCGAIGCPILESKPYTGGDIQARMDEAARRYLSGPTGLNAADGGLKVSHIFEWYAADFGGPDGVVAFLKKYGKKDVVEKAGPSPKISYVDYNWVLNAL